MIRLVLWLLLWAAPAAAESARVLSGEHGDFTRLVVELPEGSAWTLGKTAMGYAFAVPGGGQLGYDLASVWDRIPRTRLQALRSDPATGVLMLTLACRCHVFPFEYRPGVVVLDIKDGPAPAGSAFELAFGGPPVSRAPGPPILPHSGGPVSGYSWVSARGSKRQQAPDVALAGLGLPMIGSGSAFAPLRDQLLRQISAGAASGLVDMALPGAAAGTELQEGSLPWAHVSLGERPGLTVGATPLDEPPLQPHEECIADDVLDLPGWGREVSPADLVSTARAGIYGEFDRPDPEAIMRAVRQHLFLGFGAEARQYAALSADDPDQRDMAVLLSLSRLVDGETDPNGPFATMAGCEGRAALWAALAATHLSTGPDLATDAALRSFLELPAHLRRSLGPDLAEKFLDRKDMEAVRIIRDALGRQAEPPASVAVLDAKVDLLAGRGEEARQHAETALTEGANSEVGLVALVDAHFRDLQPLSPEVATGLAAFLSQAETAADRQDLQRALILALALSDQTAAAFELAKAVDQPTGDLWAVAVARAADDAFLTEAVPAPPASSPRVAAVADIAARLLALGFPDAALDWLGPIGVEEGPERRRLAAEGELARGAASVALQHLLGLAAPEDELLRARALVQLGRYEPARRAFLAAGRPEEADRLLPWMADWSGLPSDETDPWRAVASDPGPSAGAEDAGPLARGRLAAETSAATRSAITDLLQAVERPSG
jgi:hypothetical protein